MTDSLFLSALPIVKHRYPNINIHDDVEMSKRILEIATDVQAFINKSYDTYSQKIHNVKDHRFYIKQELIGKSGVWFAKKRYAIKIINKETVPVDELEIKGLDVVRSDYPKAFQTFMAEVLEWILADQTENDITDKLIDFRKELDKISILDIMIPTGVKHIDKYDSKYRSKFEIIKGTPYHVKAALRYNDMLKHLNIRSVRPIKSGEKIKIAYLKNNPYNLDSVALRGYDDPEPVFKLVSEYIDIQLIFNNMLVSKIQDFYNALNWGKIVLNNKSSQFFNF